MSRVQRSPNSQRIRRSSTGHRIGESHPRARLSDEDCDLAIALHDSGLGYRQIASKFDNYDFPPSRYTIRNICKGRRRT